jgi:predicted dehydrogenase
MKSLKIGVIGLGLMGERHVRVYDKIPLIELYALCDGMEERAKAQSGKYGAKCFTDMETMLQDPELDAVDICLPDNMHLNAIELAVRYGKHIMVEKPIACVLDEAKKIYELTKNYDKVFTIGHILRFDPRYSAAKEAVSGGRLGNVVSVYARRNSPITGPSHYKGATDIDTHVMVHDIDAIEWILGSRIKTVFARASNKVLSKWNMTDCIHMMFTTESGAIGTIEACWILPECCPSSIDDRLELIGDKAVLYTENCGNGFEIIDGSHADAPDSRHWPDLNGGVSGDLYEELTAFVNCIVRGEKSIITPADGLSTIQVVSALNKSLQTGQEVIVER